MSTEICLCGKVVLCLTLLTAGVLHSAIAGQREETSSRGADLVVAGSDDLITQAR